MHTRPSKPSPAKEIRFVSGGSVPRTGTYAPLHSHCRVGSIDLLKDNLFPSCGVCGLAVRYDLVSWVSHESAQARFRLLMHTRQSMKGAPQLP